jgi:hypothetical protein
MKFGPLLFCVPLISLEVSMSISNGNEEAGPTIPGRLQSFREATMAALNRIAVRGESAR